MFAPSRSVLLVKAFLLSALAMLAAHGTPDAQCPLPDQLDGGPCCAGAVAKIPVFPKVKVNSLDICWRDCGIDNVGQCRAVWTPLVTPVTPGVVPDCGVRAQRLDLSDAAGVLKWSGRMRLVYSRTWMEVDPSGAPLQVWRFLVNGDLVPTPAAGPAPCPLPPCALAFAGQVRFTGYIDYAESCTAAGGLQVAWMLTHACDTIDHAPGFPRAGAFHPGRSYTFVGPSAGFVVAPVVANEGTPFSGLEAVRRQILPVPGTVGGIRCEFEEPFRHSLTTTPLCLCSVGLPLSQQWVLGNLSGNGVCVTTIATSGAPFLPGFLSMGIGRWTAAGTYPGVEELRWNTGGYDVSDPCTGVLAPEVYFGVTTLGGYPAVQITTTGVGLGLPPIFIDQASSVGPGGVPILNVPYRTDRILNLNE